MISANQRDLSTGSFGSGIFSNKTGVQIQSKFNDYDRLLIAELPKGSFYLIFCFAYNNNDL